MIRAKFNSLAANVNHAHGAYICNRIAHCSKPLQKFISYQDAAAAAASRSENSTRAHHGQVTLFIYFCDNTLLLKLNLFPVALLNYCEVTCMINSVLVVDAIDSYSQMFCFPIVRIDCEQPVIAHEYQLPPTKPHDSLTNEVYKIRKP